MYVYAHTRGRCAMTPHVFPDRGSKSSPSPSPSPYSMPCSPARNNHCSTRRSRCDLPPAPVAFSQGIHEQGSAEMQMRANSTRSRGSVEQVTVP